MIGFLIDMLLRANDLALLAVGLSLVYSLVSFPNVAHVQYAASGAFAAWAIADRGVPLWLAVVLSMALTSIAAVILHRAIFDRLIRSGPPVAMIGSLAVAMIAVSGFLAIFGSRPRRLPLAMEAPIMIAGAPVTPLALWTLSGTALLLAGLTMLLYFTPFGRALRALAANRTLTAACGIDPKRLADAVCALSGAFAALGGIIIAASKQTYVLLGSDLLLPVFAAAIVGGLRNPLGAFGGALIIAFGETLMTNLDVGAALGRQSWFLPLGYLPAASFSLIAIILLWRPEGLFTRKTRSV
jgi:branched-subunit amino acid ABC-type transport system permease component